MTIQLDSLEALRKLSPNLSVMSEGGADYVFLPGLRLPAGCVPDRVDGLLRPGPGPDGYTTRLFLAAQYPHRGQNWKDYRILERTWYAFSFNNVPADLPLIEILANHLNVLK